MISKLVWSDTFEKGNPFGGIDGFRPLRITFHSNSLANTIENNEQAALDILLGLAKLDNIDAMSFDGSISPQILINFDKAQKDSIGITVINAEGNPIGFSGVSTSYLEPNYIAYLLGVYSSSKEENYKSIRQEILEVKSHGALRRDIFITTSPFLLSKRDKLRELNIYTPSDALKIVGLYLRVNGEFEWISHIESNVRFITTMDTFYEFLSRGLLPKSWKYISGLGLHNAREKLLSLGWSVLNRYSRVLQARDELGRLYYMPANSSTKDKMMYHFDYLTLLLTAAFDTQALIINTVYNLGLKDQECGFRRERFKTVIRQQTITSNLANLLSAKSDFINILFDLRNKIHSVSMETNFHVPDSYPDELLERICQYDQYNHWGIQKQNVNVIINRGNPTPSINYSVDIYHLAHGLISESTNLINSIMEETQIETFLDTGVLSKIMTSPPDDMLPYIQAYLLLA
ncbi:MAG: hypothetical protein H6996_00050 [Moraxellaceae bacterium]|nr:hypothetical protein [Moraxellaceae bacterium]